MVNLLEALGVPGLLWDIIASILTLVSVFFVIMLMGQLHRRGRIRDDMLLISNHVFVAPVAVVSWLLYSNEIQSRFLAALTPAIFVILFIGILSGAIKNKKLVGMITTSDDLKVLQAPFIYSLLILIFTIIFWPVPLDGSGLPVYNVFVPTMILIIAPWTGGWGAGHFANRRWGGRKLSNSDERSLEGFLFMFIFGIASCYVLLGLYQILLYWQYAATIAILSPLLLLTVLVVSLVAAILEAISPSIYDNAIIPTGIIISLLTLTYLGIFTYPLINL